MSSTCLSMEIDQTWDGQSIGKDQVVHLLLEVVGDTLRLEVNAPFHDDPPPSGPPGATDRLWEHEVVEVFIAGAGREYIEIELGPHGHHLVIQLQDIRQPSASLIPIRYQATPRAPRWTGQAVIPLCLLPGGPHRINATAIHGCGPDRAYLSMVRLPGDTPDFHQPACFGLEASLI